MLDKSSKDFDHEISSHELASELRDLYGLPPLENEESVETITNLKGLLSNYADSEESPVDAVKSSRENLY